MGLLKKRTTKPSGLTCPACGSYNLRLGYLDRVNCTVLHACADCENRWRDGLIDLADRQLASRTTN